MTKFLLDQLILIKTKKNIDLKYKQQNWTEYTSMIFKKHLNPTLNLRYLLAT